MTLAILQNIINDFDLNELRRFFARKNRIFQPSDDSLTYFIGDKEQDLFEKGEKLGQLELPDGDLLVAAFAVKKELTERSGKKAQYELGKRILRDTNFQRFNAGIFIFYDSSKSFRFSLIYYLPQKTRRQWSTFKRYTYYVNKEKPHRTFLKNIGDCSFQSIKKIIDAFSTLPLTKEFYSEIQNWYAWALKNAWFPGGKIEENLIRLLTRLIFVWFLKEKNLVPEEIFAENFLQNIVKNLEKEDHYYNVILQNLFFATLNRKEENRKFAQLSKSKIRFLEHRKEFSIKTLYRYQDKLLIPKKDFIDLFKNTPFINGGLFECLDEDANYIDGFSREEKWRAKLPDYLFFSEERNEDLSNFYGTKTKKKVRGLINILKDYNFTADENSPIDVEVSLDPELLGHIFENLLAAYNPETQTTARKATGSYYTPKEVVEFMVDKSLFYYFKTKVGLEDGELRRLLSYDEEELDFDKEKIEKIIKAIDELKIIDPAVGSGAFPMGILQKLVYILGKVDPTNELWKEKQYQRTLKEIEDILKIENKEEREKQLKELNENFDDNINYPDYARKLYLIENSIFGVDIQPIAIQIAKLRFFLSLLIDQKVDKKQKNFGIRALPHLETKFVAANTLISLKDHGQLSLIFEDPKITEFRKELKNLYKRHFKIKNRTEKKRLQERAEKIRSQIRELLLQKGWASEEAKKLAEFDIFDQTASADWFDPEWMLGVENGFDIVIGNPPYGNIFSKDKNKEHNTLAFIKEKYPYSTLSDISSPFIEKGVELLRVNGSLFFVITYAITFNKYFSKNRELIYRSFRKSKIYTFDRDRCNIFKNMSQSISLLMCINKDCKEKLGIYTSRMFRSVPDLGSISASLCDHYLLPKRSRYSQPHRLPKIGGKRNLKILKKLYSNEFSIKDIFLKQNSDAVWIRTSGNYWYNAWDRKPYNSTEIKQVSVKNSYKDLFIILVNSSLLYFWLRIYGDGRHLNRDILEVMSLPRREVILKNSQLLQKVRKYFMNKLFSVFDSARKRFLTRYIKNEIDLLDLVLATKFYSLTYKEWIYITNYDKEVRGGTQINNSLLNKLKTMYKNKSKLEYFLENYYSINE